MEHSYNLASRAVLIFKIILNYLLLIVIISFFFPALPSILPAFIWLLSCLHSSLTNNGYVKVKGYRGIWV